jgi:hypothetical protein
LNVQGLEQFGDGVFTGTRLNGQPLKYSELSLVSQYPDNRPTGYTYDLSYCGSDGSACTPRTYGPHDSVSVNGVQYARVHQAHGNRYGGQDRTLYTTSRLEATTSGLPDFVDTKFLLRASPPDNTWLPLYRCIDWRRDMHVYWLSTTPACNNSGDDPGQPNGILGYLSTVKLPNTLPLYHLRKGTENATGIGTMTPEHDTHDHYFAVGDGDKQKSGYSLFGDQPLGYVYASLPARNPMGGLDVNGDGFADVLIGGPGYQNNEIGGAQVFLGSASGVNPAASTLVGNYGAGGQFGYSVANAGDVNGDGYSDVIVGEPAINGDRIGRAYVYLGSASGLGAQPQPATILVGPDGPGGAFGTVVAGIGDVDHDGYSDVAVSAPLASFGGNALTGRVYIYRGSANGLSTTPSSVLTGFDIAYGGGTYDGQFGAGVAGAGDVNGDGYSDVIIGAVGVRGGYGRAYVYHGGPAGLAATPAVALDPVGKEQSFGSYVAGAGDLNGDHFADVVVSGLYGVNVYYGSSSGVASSPGSIIGNPTVPDVGEFATVAAAGDVNGDGYADLLVGAYHAVGYGGNVLVYLGSANGLGAAPKPTAALAAQSGYWGEYGVAGAGDIENDGYADIIIGGLAGTLGAGGGFVYRGGAQGLANQPASRLSSSSLPWFGAAVAGANPR